MNDDTPRGPFGDRIAGHEQAGGPVRPSLPQEDIADRENVGTVRPEDYPLAERQLASHGGDTPEKAAPGSGEVHGSGAGAAGGGSPEDYDADPQGGGGSILQQPQRPAPDTGADAAIGGTR